MRNTAGMTDQNKSFIINHKKYDLFLIPGEEENLVLVPRTDGDIVRNWSYSAYQYTHAGVTYQMAVQKLKEIITESQKIIDILVDLGENGKEEIDSFPSWEKAIAEAKKLIDAGDYKKGSLIVVHKDDDSFSNSERY